MEGKPILTKVVINNITIKDDSGSVNYLLNWQKTDSYGSNQIKEMTIVCPRTIENIITIDENLLNQNTFVEVTRGINTSTEQVIFKGVITGYDVTGGIITFYCSDKLYLAKKSEITYTYDKDIDPSAGVLSEIFKDMINTYTPLTCDDTSVQNTGTELIRDKIICKSEPVFDKITKDISTPIYWNFFYSPTDDLVHLEPYGFINNSTTIETGVNILVTPTWKIDESKIYNHLTIEGAITELETEEIGQIGVTSGYSQTSVQLLHIPKIVKVLCDINNPPITEKKAGKQGVDIDFDYSIDTSKQQIIWNTTKFTPELNWYALINYTFTRPTPIVVSDPDSIAKYGEKSVTQFKKELITVNDARLYAKTLLSVLKDPVYSTKIRVANISDLCPGQRIRVKDTYNNIDDYFYLTKVTMTYPYNYDEIEVTSVINNVDECFELFTIQKLMQLDRSSIDDTTILIEEQNFSNEFIFENRYLKATKNTLIGTGGVYDNPEFGIYDTSTYFDDVNDITSEVVFLENSEQRFVELFYDTEFKDDSTTANWDTANEQLIITGTTAVSKKILCDYDGDANAYKVIRVYIYGTDLDALSFYIGENDNTSITYTQIPIAGESTYKQGTLNLTGTNKFGITWKAESDNSTITKLIIEYQK